MADGNTNIQDQAAETVIQAAKDFLEPFYEALRSSRETIASFYAPVPTAPDTLNIEYNGNKYKDGKDVQAMFESEMPPALFETLTYNCHRLNPNYAQTGKPSLLIMVSGILRVGDGRKKGDSEAAIEYSETFTLIPNKLQGIEKAPIAKGSTPKSWLIQSQVFRVIAQVPGNP